MGNNLPREAFLPAYVPIITFTEGAFGDDVYIATAATTDPYTPRTQSEKAGMLNTPLAVDVARRRGWIEPSQPYGPRPPAATLTALTPNTAQVGDQPLIVVLTGTGFTPWSQVTTGNVWTDLWDYVSPTELRIIMDPSRAEPGLTEIRVIDQNLVTAPLDFTFTAAP